MFNHGKPKKLWELIIKFLSYFIALISKELHKCKSFFFVSPFPTVAESIQKELDEYRASEEEVKRLKNVMVGFKVCSLV